MRIAVLPVLALLAAAPAPARSETLVALEDLRIDELAAVGFELPRAARVRVEAVALRPRWDRDPAASAWILDSSTRAVVWSLEDERGDRVRGKHDLRRVQETLDLGAGRYELYAFTTSRSSWHGIRIEGIEGLRWLFRKDDGWNDDRDRRSSRSLRRALAECHVRLSADGIRAGQVPTFEPTGELPGTLLRHTQLGDDAFVQSAFTLDRDARLRIRALVEFPESWDVPVDNGWIVDAATRKRVWEITERNTRHAGGADKNRIFDDDVTFAKGTYVLCFGTDGSHSYAEFNALPPHDPLNWGVTVLAGKDLPAGAFRSVEVPARGTPLLELVRVRDGEYLEQPFRLERDMELHILALGEYAHRSREFADGAWIQKAGGGDEVVWEMTEDNTAHAGGAEKNRMFDGAVKLPAGDYVGCYSSDDSHAYRAWNAAPPFEPEAWGLTLWAAPGADARRFRKLDDTALADSGSYLVRLVRIGNDARVSQEFELRKPARVRIYALGEGARGSMYDYGTIADKRSGDVVWEMTWRNTRHAGGARKNRVFDGVIMLDAGTYTAHYESDDSHSFPAWNDTRPRDARSWGITVTRAE